VAEAAHNPVLNIVANAVNESIRDPISRSKLTYEMRSRIVTSHRSVFEAMRSRDVTRARTVMTQHIVDVQCHLDSSNHEGPASSPPLSPESEWLEPDTLEVRTEIAV
jgi:DNA-binding FadR family transcriptional regulator